MFSLSLLLLSLYSVSHAYIYEESLLLDSFPVGFKWGVATAAYQIEGGWDEDGKGMNIWDTFTSIPGNIDDGSDGKIACDSYHKYKEDVQLIKSMGLTSYRFSIAWTRIMPNGTLPINQAGINYYNDLITELLANGIEPVATLYHWDIPQAHQDLGGWTDPNIATYFEEYARFCFAQFGANVKQWITLNEPYVTSINGYGTGEHAPGLTGIGDLVYQAAHNQIRAHAKAYRVYETEFKPTQTGMCGITLNIHWKVAENETDQAHLDARETRIQFELGWFGHPIFIDGEYPPIMRQKVGGRIISKQPQLSVRSISGSQIAIVVQSSNANLLSDRQ